jgi:Uncharacterized conserved protein
MHLAVRRVAEHITGVTRTDFLASRTIQAAVEREISILGEAAGRVSEGFRNAHSDIPWMRIIRLRHFYTHAYERLDAREVWTTARRFIPQLERVLSALVQSEETETQSERSD